MTGASPGKNHLETFTDNGFEKEVLGSELPVLVDFYADWCGPCQALAPVIEEIAEEYAGRLKVGKLNTDLHSATAARYGIRGIPTLLLFRDGKLIGQHVGLASRADLRRALDAVLAGG